MTPLPLTPRDVQVSQLSVPDSKGSFHQVTRVKMWVGDHGPFMQDFGPGQPYQDDAQSIQTWKDKTVAKLMAVAGQ